MKIFSLVYFLTTCTGSANIKMGFPIPALVFALLLLFVRNALAGVQTLSAEEEDRVLELWRQHCGPGITRTVPDNGRWIHCKVGNGTVSQETTGTVNLNSSQVVFIQPPRYDITHYIKVGQNDSKIDVYVKPPKLNHTYVSSSDQAPKPIVYFLNKTHSIDGDLPPPPIPVDVRSPRPPSTTYPAGGPIQESASSYVLPISTSPNHYQGGGYYQGEGSNPTVTLVSAGEGQPYVVPEPQAHVQKPRPFIGYYLPELSSESKQSLVVVHPPEPSKQIAAKTFQTQQKRSYAHASPVAASTQYPNKKFKLMASGTTVHGKYYVWGI